MAPRQTLTTDANYDSLAWPIRNAGPKISTDPATLIHNGTEFFGSGQHVNNRTAITPQAEMQIINTGSIQILAARSSPCITREEGHGDYSTLAMPYAGDIHRFKEGITTDVIAPGEIHLNPRSGGSVTVGYFSGLIATIEHQRLKRTIQAISRTETSPALAESIVIRNKSCAGPGGACQRLWSFIRFIDQLLGESEHLPASLGLDEQIYRLLAVALLERTQGLEQLQAQGKLSQQPWNNSLDELVDYIRANTHLQLTLTDLEEKSHYSARHLQNLFRGRFDCTPMQFVRRQRLAHAMEKLQTADWHESVSSIARDCGYRFTSNFTTDFQRQFGVNPSTVLRGSRGNGRTSLPTQPLETKKTPTAETVGVRGVGIPGSPG